MSAVAGPNAARDLRGAATTPVRRLSRLRLERFELAVLVALASLSLWTIALALWQVLVHGRIWTGSETVFFEDGFQSMMWIQGILHHGASPDLYTLAHTPADYFQPLIAISAALTGLGLAPYLALLVWKPVALAGVFFAIRAYLARTVSGCWPGRVALVLALFFAWGQVIGDSWIVFWTWGYPFALLGLACMIGALITYARARTQARFNWLAPALGVFASWLHPWQGETLILVLIGCELVVLVRGGQVAWRALTATAVASVLPLLYFALLVHFDKVWQFEHEAALSSYSLSHVLSVLAPLLVPSLLAYRLPARGFLAISARVWLPVSFLLFGFSQWQGSGATHALLGITVPLAVLSVEGVRSLPWHALAERTGRYPNVVACACALVLAALTIPGAVYMLGYAQEHVEPKPGRSTFIKPGENAALSYLARDPRAGGVLSSFYLGMLVPVRTARNTYIGNCYWSEPHCRHRSQMVQALFNGKLPGARGRAFVRSTGARFVLADCRSHDLRSALAPISGQVRTFGCATLYTIRKPPQRTS